MGTTNSFVVITLGISRVTTEVLLFQQLHDMQVSKIETTNNEIEI